MYKGADRRSQLQCDRPHLPYQLLIHPEWGAVSPVMDQPTLWFTLSSCKHRWQPQVRREQGKTMCSSLAKRRAVVPCQALPSLASLWPLPDAIEKANDAEALIFCVNLIMLLINRNRLRN